MPAIVYRSARVVIQNSTNTLWTLDSAELLFGTWAGQFDPYKNTPRIAAQSAVVLSNHSMVLQHGAEGFARFSSAEGQLHLHWNRPWVGPFRIEKRLSFPGFRVSIEDQTEMPAYAVAIVSIHDAPQLCDA